MELLFLTEFASKRLVALKYLFTLKRLSEVDSLDIALTSYLHTYRGPKTMSPHKSGENFRECSPFPARNLYTIYGNPIPGNVPWEGGIPVSGNVPWKGGIPVSGNVLKVYLAMRTAKLGARD